MHADGFHKSEAAKARCWGCSFPDRLVSTEDDQAKAERLYKQGWFSTSNKYRRFSRVHVPTPEIAMTFDPEVPEWLRRHMVREYAHVVRSECRGNLEKVEHIEVSLGVYQAYKRLLNSLSR